MAYQQDPLTGDIIIGGFEKGIADSPYSGITDIKNMNITSVPGEAAVGMKTSSLTSANSFTNLTATASGDGTQLLVSGVTNPNNSLEIGQSISFSGGTVTGLGTGTTAYVATTSEVGANQIRIGLTLTYGGTTATYAIGTSGTTAFSTLDMVLGRRGILTKNYIQESSGLNTGGAQLLSRWIADNNGRVWSDIVTTTGSGTIPSTNSWTYTGNTVDTTSFGNGLTYLSTVNSSGGKDGWLFLFRSGQIDYLKVVSGDTPILPASLAWVYGWNPSTGTVNQSGYLNSCNSGQGGIPTTTAVSHEGVVTPDGRLCYCDGYIIARFYQNPPVVNVWTTFNPQSTSTYTYNTYPILPTDDIATCMSYLGSHLLIGGQKNRVYPWNLTDTQYSNPLILLPESYTNSIVTVKQSAYIFAGNRGRIYITNGSQADLWKKVPDHISNTVQPLFFWGGAAYNQNQLYFGLAMQSSGAIASGNLYGGVWGADINSGALYLANQTSDASYTGYVTAILPFTDGIGSDRNLFAGYGLYIGRTSNLQTTSGVDVTVNTPYTGGQSYVISDMIPVGTLLKPTTPLQFEYKLSAPLLSGEKVELQTARYVGGTFTSLGTTSGLTSSTSAILSDVFSGNDQKYQWLMLKAISTGTSASPSYNRITQLRIIGGIPRP